ncbi:MAG: response regulator [Planctomycetota bacterium]|jgi:pilus assembly protein CpaE|nr:MAG: response regulator [Planctomycetota bacterium]
MRDVQRVVIVDPSDATREPLRNLLLGVESVWLEAECSRYEFFFDVVHQSKPDVAVIALDSDEAKALQLISTLASETPDMPILAVSGKGDGQSILKALRSGAREFLTQPVVLEDLLTALQRLQAHRAPRGEAGSANGTVKTESLVVSVLGSRGGIGCTSVAVNLGCTLAQEAKNSVALIDLDMALGDTDVALDLMPVYTLADVAMNIERLDMTFLKRSLISHATGLSLLPHPVQMGDVGLIHEDHLQRVIGLLRASYTHLILDLSKRFTPMDLTALRMSDVILLIAQLELSSLRNVVRMLLTLGSEEGLSDKVQIVINRVGCDFFDGAISFKKAEETIGKPVYWQLPNDPKSMMSSRNAGVPLLQHAPRSKIQLAIAGLAEALCGKVEATETKKKKTGFLSFR